jgi:hypothetical protein
MSRATAGAGSSIIAERKDFLRAPVARASTAGRFAVAAIRVACATGLIVSGSDRRPR